MSERKHIFVRECPRCRELKMTSDQTGKTDCDDCATKKPAIAPAVSAQDSPEPTPTPSPDAPAPTPTPEPKTTPTIDPPAELATTAAEEGANEQRDRRARKTSS